MERLTKAAHDRDIPITFDCSHSFGVVPHRFDDWGIDFAFFPDYDKRNRGQMIRDLKHFQQWWEDILEKFEGYKQPFNVVV